MEIGRYGQSTNSDTDQILRMVREGICAKQGGERPTTGMRGELHEAPFLLAFLFDLEAARNRTPKYRRSKKAGAEIIERAVRSVRGNGGYVRPPHQRQSEGQSSEQPPTSMPELSLLLARMSEAHAQAAVSTHAAAVRVGLLRGAGNSVVPQVAAEFIRASGLGR